MAKKTLRQGSGYRCLLCKQEVTPGVSLFPFPLDERRRTWADFCGIDQSILKPYHRLCSLHFDKSSFKTRPMQCRRIRLQSDAIPTTICVNNSPIDPALRSKFSGQSKYRNAPKGHNRKSRNRWCLLCGSIDSRFHLFRFPKVPDDLTVWLNACNMEEADMRENDRLCDAHFEDGDVLTEFKPPRLRKGAIPVKLLAGRERDPLAVSDDDGEHQMEVSSEFDDTCSEEEGAAYDTFCEEEGATYMCAISMSSNELSPQPTAPPATATRRNVEVKARVTNDQVLENMKTLSDQSPEVIDQEDYFFNVPVGRLKLRSLNVENIGKWELIYYDRPDSDGPKLSNYKKVDVDNGRGLLEVLRASLGVKGKVKKRRLLFMYGQTRMHYDEVENLGTFMELEVVLREDQRLEEGLGIANDILGKLRVSKEDFITGAYMDLLLDKA